MLWQIFLLHKNKNIKKIALNYVKLQRFLQNKQFHHINLPN